MIIKTVLRNQNLWVLVWILWMGVIFSFSHIPGSPIYYEPSFWLLIERKGAHVVEYAVLFLLSVQVFSLFFFKESLVKIAALAAVWSLTYAALDELHQFFTPFRGAHMRDIGIDMIGILLAMLAVFILFSRQRKKT